MVTPGMVDGQSGAPGYAVSHVVVGREYRRVPVQILSLMCMEKAALGTACRKVNAITSDVEKSHQVGYYICIETKVKK
jgi:hypothetical protein